MSVCGGGLLLGIGVLEVRDRLERDLAMGKEEVDVVLGSRGALAVWEGGVGSVGGVQGRYYVWVAQCFLSFPGRFCESGRKMHGVHAGSVRV